MKLVPYILLLTSALLITACTSRVHEGKNVDALPPIFPDYIGVTVPAEIAPLNFAFDHENAYDKMDVTITGSKAGELHIQGDYASFPIKQWHQLLEENRGGDLTISVCGKRNGEWLKYQDFKIHVSSEPLNEWGLTYRRIAPGYEVYSKMGIYQRDLSTFDEFAIIENTLTQGQCYNCHTANRTNPDQFVFHVRGNHGATMIQQNGEREWLKAVNDSLGGAMVYPYWHPSGRYIAFSTNQTRQGFHVVPNERIEVFDLSSDVLVYDIEKHEILLDTLLSRKDISENCPVFSPDGRTIYFTQCTQKSYPLEFKDEKYNLCRIGFDPEQGKIVGKIDTLFNAVDMDKSVTWPKPSYDGRFLMFTLLDYGYFSIWHKESDQWLLDLATGEAHPLTDANSDDADSFHNWSADSRWFVFTSRRGDGLYSRLYLAAIDENGNSTKPFLLPQKNPHEYYDQTLYSFNTPDFTSAKVDFDAHKAADEILAPKRIPTQLIMNN